MCRQRRNTDHCEQFESCLDYIDDDDDDDSDDYNNATCST